MESLLILAAVVATLIACFLVVGLSKSTRRAPLRLPREEEWAENEEAVARALAPSRSSPIDRAVPVLDLEAIDRKLIEHREEGTVKAEGAVKAGGAVKARSRAG